MNKDPLSWCGALRMDNEGNDRCKRNAIPVSPGMADAPIEAETDGRVAHRREMAVTLACVLVVHFLLLVVLHAHVIAASRYATVALGLVAVACVWLRSERVAGRERTMLRWLGAGMFLWIVAHCVETVLGPPLAASSLAVDPSDMIYVVSGFPLL